jgi:hypothetical protein
MAFGPLAIQPINALLTVNDLVELLQIDCRTIERMRAIYMLSTPDLWLGIAGIGKAPSSLLASRNDN